MSDSATVNRAARVIAQVSPQLPADAALREELRGHRRISPAEQRAVVRAVYAHYRWFGWLDSKSSLQARLSHALSLQDRYDRDPAAIKSEALAARAVPAWLAEEMLLAPDYLRQLQREPALWIRVQDAHRAAVPRALGSTTPGPAPATHALHYTGTKDLFKTPEFHQGLFEIQDLGSQLVGHACAPSPGETWWDACAGEGGKTLHLADLMGNRGLIWASDRSARRLERLRQRAKRAQVFNYRVAPWNGGPLAPTKTKFDGILVDAPCSGVGTWQRHPHARWTVTPADLTELAALQLQLLHHVASSLKPGGRLLYAVCIFTRTETTAVADAFTDAHPDLIPLPLLNRGPQLTLWPHEWNANGMFLAAWQRPQT
jgi:16S rRNA (cytosine967-C5)-methyltransferase